MRHTNLLPEFGAYLSPGGRRVLVELVGKELYHVVDVPLRILIRIMG